MDVYLRAAAADYQKEKGGKGKHTGLSLIKLCEIYDRVAARSTRQLSWQKYVNLPRAFLVCVDSFCAVALSPNMFDWTWALLCRFSSLFLCPDSL